MKQRFLLKTMLLLCALVAGSSSVWAGDILTLDCATPAPTGSTSTALTQTTIAEFLNSAAGLSDEITCSAKSGDVYKGKGSGGGDIPQQCLKVGKASSGGGFTFTIPDTYDEIGSVEITCYGWKTTSSISINGGTAKTFTTAQVEATKTFSLASATRTIAIDVTTSAVCITEIVLKSAETGEATTVTIDDSGITNTDVASGTAAGSLSAVVKDASSNTIAAAAVTWSSSKPGVATINSTTGEVTLVKKGSTTITASYAGVDGTYISSNTTYVLNVTNSAAGDGTAAHPFTATEARDALDASEIDAEETYYVKGYIAKIGTLNDAGQLTYWISDDGSMTNNVQCFKGKNIDGAAFTAVTDLEVGDIATVKGKLLIYSGTTYELNENNEVVNITPRTKVNIATFTATTNPLILGVTETTATSVTNDQTGWTPASYSYESDDETVATVNASGVITAIAKGTANITVTPVVSATDPAYKVGTSKSLEITVSNPSHTATFSVNGETSNETVEEGEDIPFPAATAAIGGKTFVGWTTAPIVGSQAAAPAVLVTSATMSTDDITYYAVFAIKKTTAAEFTKSYGFETESDADWTIDGPARNDSYKNTGSYSGKITTNNSYVTFKNKVNVKEFSFAFTRTSTNNNYNVYVETSTDGTAWTAAETYAMSTFNSDGTFTTKTKTFDGKTAYYVRFHCYNTTAARYVDDVTIKYDGETTTYSAYCTSISTAPVPVTITTAEYATFCNELALDFSATGITVYTAEDKETSVALNEVATGKVPANTPVVLYKAGADGSAIDVPVIASADAIAGTNDLHVSTGTDVANMYVLAKNPTIGFYPWAGTTDLSAGKIYLQGKASYGAREFLGFDINGEATGVSRIENGELKMENIYNLNGQRVAQPTKGLYIVNGKKVIIK